MQLIDIIKLFLIGFVVVSLIIFGFSYIGYKRQTKLVSKKKLNKMERGIKIENAAIKEELPIKNSDLRTSPEKLIKKTSNINKNKKKFEVFKPSPADSSVSDTKAINNKT